MANSARGKQLDTTGDYLLAKDTLGGAPREAPVENTGVFDIEAS